MHHHGAACHHPLGRGWYRAPVPVAKARPSNAELAQRDAATALADAAEPRVAAAFRAAVEAARGGADLKDVVAGLRAGSLDQVLAALQVERMRRELGAVAETLRSAYEASGRTMAAMLGSGVISDPVEVRFDVLAPGPIRFLQTYGLGLIRGIDQQTREAVRTVLVQGLRAGDHPFTTARTLRDVIGLTDRQAGAVARYRSELESLDRNALARRLRDARSDGPVRRAIADGVPLPHGRINALVERYRARTLNQRAETVAATESARALGEGQMEAVRQATVSGGIDRPLMRRFWLVSRDERLCPSCSVIPRMNADGVGLDEPFRTPLGPVMTAPVHPRCRCSQYFRQATGNRYLDMLNPVPVVVPNVRGERLSLLSEDYGRSSAA